MSDAHDIRQDDQSWDDVPAYETQREEPEMIKCQHPRETNSVDLATGDLFCGDCGDLLQAYRHQPDRLSGEEVATFLGNKLAQEDQAGYIVVQSIQNASPNKFWVTARHTVGDSIEWLYYTVTRGPGNKLDAKEGTL